jgi:aryl-alcohol dehydrogenase-like predicted oxidoreductase
VVIPGARTPQQAHANAAAGSGEPLSPEILAALERIYDEHVRVHVHDRW